ncbi:MAG TPA: T9SS type A sorting domain-containing protein [Bacteroidales bacterium]|nr:T9SS type A sorting domain-containing protein [Bacteroidales bacterium]
MVTNLPIVYSTGISTCRNLTIDPSASLSINANKDLSINGIWTNNGNADVGNGLISFTGNTGQIIHGNTNFENLKIYNPYYVHLNNSTGVKGVLMPALGTLISNGNLTLHSSASKTALVAGTGLGSISGDVTMQRYMANKMGYHYYSSPFTAASVNEFVDEIGIITSGDPYGGTNDTLQTVSPFPNFYAYDETQPYYMQIGWTGAGATMTPMRGYCINFGAAGGALTTDVTGQVNNGSQNYIVTNTASPYPNADGWNLVGNPYPSPIDWNATSGWNKSNIVNSVYFFNPTTQYTGTYSTYAGGIGVPGNINGIIPAMQGFFVKATVSSGAFSVTNDARISELNPVFHKSIANTTLLRLKGHPAANQASGDETVIYFDTQATNVFDDNFDAYKWMNNDPAFPNLFTRDSTPNSLAINALPPLANTDVVIPLGFTTKTGGSFTIKATEILNFDPALHIYLEDNQNSTSQDLTLDPDYTFSINANDPLYRFFIRFSPAMVTNIDENGSSFVDAWSSGKDIYVNYSNTAMQNAEISVYNMLGQKVISAAQKGSGTARYRVEEPGCYIINVINGSNTYQKKVVIM